MQFMQIMNSASNLPFDLEILERNYVSRLYYTAFLHCSNTLGLLNDKVEGESSHNYVINKLDNEYLLTMVHLKKLRKDADYNLKPFGQPFKFKNKNVKVQMLKARLDDILNQDKASLSA